MDPEPEVGYISDPQLASSRDAPVEVQFLWPNK